MVAESCGWITSRVYYIYMYSYVPEALQFDQVITNVNVSIKVYAYSSYIRRVITTKKRFQHGGVLR